MEVIWREVALDGLERARRYIGRNNPAAAERVRERILIYVGRLGNLPNLGRLGRVDGTRELVIPGTPYIVAYTVLDDRIALIAMQHSAGVAGTFLERVSLRSNCCFHRHDRA